MTEQQILALKNLVGAVLSNLERNHGRLSVIEDILNEQLNQVRAGAEVPEGDQQC